MRNFSNALLIGFFVVFLCGFAVLTFASPETGYSTSEKRKLAEFPKLTRETITTFPLKFEQYASDHMGLRKQLIQARAILKYNVWGVSGSPSVLVGQQDWLYFLGDGSAPVFRREQPFTQKELSQWKAVLKQRTEWCASHGIKYVFVVAPDKPSIYPEFLPVGFRPVREESRLDQLSAALKDEPGVKFVNLAEDLRTNKSKGVLYLKTDTHWNHVGAYIGYAQLMRTLNGWFPALTPIAMSQLKFTMSPFTQGDCLGLMGLFGLKQEVAPALTKCGNLSLHPQESIAIAERNPEILRKSGAVDGSQFSNLKVLVLHDSFGDGLKPFLAQHFSNIKWVRQDDLSCDADVILPEKPDILIQEVVERHASQGTPYFLDDWRQWVISNIQDEHQKQAYVTLLPNTSEINVRSLSKLAQCKEAGIVPISCREWTEHGDKVAFNQQTALYSQWYLLKTGDQGFHFIDTDSQKSFEALTRFVTKSGKYRKAAEMKLSNGSLLQLYKQK